MVVVAVFIEVLVVALIVVIVLVKTVVVIVVVVVVVLLAVVEFPVNIVCHLSSSFKWIIYQKVFIQN